MHSLQIMSVLDSDVELVKSSVGQREQLAVKCHVSSDFFFLNSTTSKLIRSRGTS
jgi:hypothetical protein